MKQRLSFLMFLWLITANAQQPFTTTWQVANNDLGLGIEIPIMQDDDNDYTVDFGDGTVLTNQTGPVTNTYNNPGIYTVTISGTFKRIKFWESNLSSRFKIKTIVQWGTNQWESMEQAFMGCQSLVINATDTPDLSQVTNMSHMFNGTGSGLDYNNNLNTWDVSNVTDMASMFETSSFNSPLNNWDVSNVTDMNRMFILATNFNQPLNNWDVSSVTNMQQMFQYTWVFNQPLNSWDVSNVTNMTGMFFYAMSFNQPLNNWNTSNVLSMYGLFSSTPFNQPLNDWNTSNVINMQIMFDGATAFNQPLTDWDVSNVTNMTNMFNGASGFNQDISGWNFNSDVIFYNSDAGSGSKGFLNNSGLDMDNYDAVLDKFVQLGLQNKTLLSGGLQYCNVTAHNYLINELGWTITGDSQVEGCTAGIDNLTQNSILIYPNPVSSILNIESTNEILSIEIYNLQGQKVLSVKSNTVNFADLPTGIYIVRVTDVTNRITTSRIIRS